MRISLIVVALNTLASNQHLQGQDTIRVRADGPPVWGRHVRLIKELALGQADGPPEYAFGGIYQVAPEPSGAFYVFDGKDVQIRRYNHDGRFTGSIGRRGSGPGEYESIGGMMVDADNSLVVYDGRNHRITHFSPEGRIRRERSFTRNAWDEFTLDVAGRFYFRVPLLAAPTEGTGFRAQFLRTTPDGSNVDSFPIVAPSNATPATGTLVLATNDGLRKNFVVEGFTVPNLAGGIVSATSDAYRITVVDGIRRPMVIEREMEPVQLKSEERAQWLEWADSMRVRSGRQYEIPRTKPFLRSILSDHQGRIWAEVYVEGERRRNLPAKRADGGKQILLSRERSTFDVLSPTGHYLGRVVLPEETVLLAISGNRLYTRSKGPFDEEQLVVYRLAIP